MSNAQYRISEARERFRQEHGRYPSVIEVGSELYARAWPDRYYPAQAIGETLVIPKDFCGKFGLVIPFPPECKTNSKLGRTDAMLAPSGQERS